MAGSELEGLHREVLVRAIKVGAAAGGRRGLAVRQAGRCQSSCPLAGRPPGAAGAAASAAARSRRVSTCRPPARARQVLEGQGRAKLFKGAGGEDEGIKFFAA